MRTLDVKKLENNIDKTLNGYVDECKINGAQIIINQCGERVFHKIYGYKNDKKEILEENAVYRLASMTKPITTVAVLNEVSKGNIDLDKYVYEYLPGFKNLYIAKLENDIISIERPSKCDPKVWHLLSHVSGIGSDMLGVRQFDDMIDEKSGKTLDGVVSYFSYAPLAFDPMTKQAYSPSAAFDVAAKIVENTSGMAFDKYLQETIFDKLGMKDTTFAPTEEQFDRMVAVHNRNEEGKCEDKEMPKDCVFEKLPVTRFCAGGGLISTGEDYSAFAEMLLDGGVAKDGTRVIDEKMIQLMQTPQVPESIMEGLQRWGLGVRVIVSDKDVLPKGAFGWSGAYGTHFWVDPANRITAIYLKNSCYDGGAGAQTAYAFERDVMGSFKD